MEQKSENKLPLSRSNEGGGRGVGAGEGEPRLRKPMTEIARQLRRRMTPAESRFWRIVRGKQCGGLRFLRQHDVGPFVLDFYCASAKAAIEIDGPLHDRPEITDYDRNRETALHETYGIRFIRLSNEFVLSTPAEEIHTHLLAAIAQLP